MSLINSLSKKSALVILIMFASLIFLTGQLSFVKAGHTDVELILYTGPVYHVFFHNLIIYPEKAKADIVRAKLFQNNMITVEEFKVILQKLYDNNFILFDSRLLYSVDSLGEIHQKPIYVPKGKKPLILSEDDLDYYSSMKNDGFASKLVVRGSKIKTEVIAEDKKVIETDDGDVVPIVEAFIEKHSDFSLGGARGILGVTGYEGILGYRTQLSGAAGVTERTKALSVVSALKKSGWIFANHSYSHTIDFMHDTISSSELLSEIALWKKEVEPLVGATNIFIGPFGQIFKEGDTRRDALVSSGYQVLYGVGIDNYVRYFDTYVIMDRIDVDGYRLVHNKAYLHKYLGI